MGTRCCMDCGSTDDVKAHKVDSWPADKWGAYCLCCDCRFSPQARGWTDWGTLGRPAQSGIAD